MALALDPATKVISVPQADLSLVSGTLWALDTDQFRKDVMTLLASEAYIWMPNPYNHNPEVTIFGTTYARTLEFINGFSITFEDTGSAYSIRLDGSNNNIADIDNNILNPTSLTVVIPTNAAGLITSAGSISGVDIDNIADAVWEEARGDHETAGSFGEWVGKKLLTLSQFFALK
jgi:hypothetical protein